jgi:hypothetical protein
MLPLQMGVFPLKTEMLRWCFRGEGITNREYFFALSIMKDSGFIDEKEYASVAADCEE